jgi:hypothetical protein
VARPSDVLRSFRLRAVPGNVGIAGLPDDHAALLREDLAPVFAALCASESGASDIVLRATPGDESGKTSAVLEARHLLHEASLALADILDAAFELVGAGLPLPDVDCGLTFPTTSRSPSSVTEGP